MELRKSVPPSRQPLQIAAHPESSTRPKPAATPFPQQQPVAARPPSLINVAPWRVLVTDAGYKHAIALAQYIRRDLPDVHLTGYRQNGVLLPKLYGCFDELISGEPLEELLERGFFHQIIPVGANSTLTVARLRPDLAALPSAEALETVYSKSLTLQLAQTSGIPVPRTQVVTSLKDLVLDEVTYPCVLKADREAAPDKKVVYCRDRAQLLKRAEPMIAAMKQPGSALLVQEYVKGPGHGFFALLDHGTPLRIFMHERLREFPPTGGISTAAAAFYSPRLEELGSRLLAKLRWHGVAMAEFRYDLQRQEFFLMEVNGKFWGSLELGLRAGVNFGADLIRLYRNKPLQPDFRYDRGARFYWPLDGDLQTLWRTGQIYPGIFDYFRPGAETNLGRSKRADWLKFFRNMLQLVKAE